LSSSSSLFVVEYSEFLTDSESESENKESDFDELAVDWVSDEEDGNDNARFFSMDCREFSVN